MPNWCEGNIRFRGTYANIKKFLMNEIVACRFDGKTGENVEEKVNIEDTGYSLIISLPSERHWFYIKTTRRNFFDGDDPLEIWMDEEDEKNGKMVVCIDRFKAAWSFEKCDAWIAFAKKYDFDVKMWGYEKGMLFEQVKTILRDGTVKEEVKEYEPGRWDWDCPMPNYGG